MSKHRRRSTKHIINKSLEYTGAQISDSDLILVDYKEDYAKISIFDDASKMFHSIDPNANHWVRIWGISDTLDVESVGKYFGLHYVEMQDFLIPQHVVKVQDSETHISAILNLLVPDGNGDLQQERLALVFGKDFILSFQEKKESYFSEVAMALQDNIGNIRNRKSDYIFCLLMNLILDKYVELISDIEENLENLEDDLLESISTDDRKEEIQKYRRQQQQLRKAIIPLKEALIRLSKCDSDLIMPNVRIYFGDLADRAHFLVESLENMREMVMGLMDLYLANNDLRMNEIMKRLTVVSTIFIPLTFLAGVWGMNFEVMPETKFKYGYFAALITMIVVAFSVWVYLKRRKWYD